MAPQRNLRALAKEAGMTKQQYQNLESRARKKAWKDSGREAVVNQAYRDLPRVAERLKS